MRILVENRQKALDVRLRAVERAAQALAGMAGRAEGGAAWGEISLAIADDRGITEWNRIRFGRTRPTDVISVGYPRPSPDGWLCDGEVCINAERAGALGERFGGAARELALYLAHGINHLTGRDDGTPADRRRMRRRELRWLKRLEEMGLISDLTATRRSPAQKTGVRR